MEIRFTIVGEKNETIFSPVKTGDTITLCGILSDGEKCELPLVLGKNNVFSMPDVSQVEEDEDVIAERLLGLSEEWLENESIGVEAEQANESAGQPGYSPDDIFVENKPFSLRQLMDLIDSDDIDLTPNFQRHFVWDNTRQSRLIESIFLGLPLPSIYLSQYDDGKLTVVDGLQRLNTIRRFMKNELRLSNLEYLKECNGFKYDELHTKLSPLRLRKFGQTPIMCFVIDYRSPIRLKFDLFRRLNTGGKPLNNQEIRNCLSRPLLQQTLRSMVQSDSFKLATSNSVKDIRMDAQEVALRFMFFYDQYSVGQPIGSYNGYMESTLDDYVDCLNRKNDFQEYSVAFEQGLSDAYRLFGRYAFRKVELEYNQKSRNQVNKLLMTAILVLLSKHQKEYRKKIDSGVDLTPHLAHLITNDNDLFRAITWSTNAKWNVEYVLATLREDLFDKYLRD